MLHDRTELWLKRIHYLGFIGFSLPLITVVFSFCSHYSLIKASLGLWELIIIGLVAFSAWSFRELRFKNNTALLACKILLFIILAAHIFSFYKILSHVSFAYIFTNVQTFTQIANVISTSLFIASCFWVMWRFLLPLNFEDEYPDEYAIDLHAYNIGIFASISFLCAALNHLQIDSSVPGYRISISSGGLVMYGFWGWRIFHSALLIISTCLTICCVFRMTKWASKVCNTLKLMFLITLPFGAYTIFSSKLHSDFSSQILMFMMFLFILGGLVAFFHWLADSFDFIHNTKIENNSEIKEGNEVQENSGERKE